MCANRFPLGLTLLHALRIEASTGSGASATFLTLNGLAATGPPARALAELLVEKGCVAPPGEPLPWPFEQGLLEALARVDREPEQAETLLAFLPPASRARGLALLTEIARCLSADVSARLKHPAPARDPVLH